MSFVFRHTLSAGAIALALFVATPAMAQQDVNTSATIAAPTTDYATVGVRRIVDVNPGEFRLKQERDTRPVVLMVVGGATMLVGSVIGDDAGTIVTIGGAAIFLYGVYQYIR